MRNPGKQELLLLSLSSSCSRLLRRRHRCCCCSCRRHHVQKKCTAYVYVLPYDTVTHSYKYLKVKYKYVVKKIIK